MNAYSLLSDQEISLRKIYGEMSFIKSLNQFLDIKRFDDKPQ